ncbi:MAG: excinuclease ABC subunit UvrC [Bacillota bacterium]
MGADTLEARARAFPAQPGVYFFKDEDGRVLYVGKAASLRQRMRSYFGSRVGPRVHLMVARARQLEYIVTKDPVEALILELNLIKRHRPPFNIRLRDDKHYPYLRVTLEENYPRLLIARRQGNEGSRYFGPFTRAGSVHATMNLTRRLFPQRTCGNQAFAQAKRPCLNFHIRRCPGPCTGQVEHEAYRAITGDLVMFLEGRHEDLIRRLQEKMEEAAERLEFERAAALRDQLQAVREVTGSQPVVAPGGRDSDVLAFARSGNDASALVFWVRHGKLVGRESFQLTGVEGKGDREVMTALVEQYYQRAAAIPDEVIVTHELKDAGAVREWLKKLKRNPVRLIHPRRGDRVKLVRLAEENARLALEELKPASERQREQAESASLELAQILELPGPPSRLECFDVSNLQGKQAVASMVVFQDGQARKDLYRKFRIRSVPGSDDYAMLREAVQRRYARGLRQRGTGETSGFSEFPDLLVVDGGRGQLNVTLEVLEELGVRLPVIGLAKEEEEVYVPGRAETLRLPRDGAALHLLQRLRDEAHRFALGYHRRVRNQDSLRSLLDEVSGIGPRRRAALLRQFGSLTAIREKTVDELARVPGMNRKAAQDLKDYLSGWSRETKG